MILIKMLLTASEKPTN